MKKSRAAVAPAAMLAISPVVSPALAVDVVFTVGEGAVESYVDAVFMDEVRIVVLNVDAAECKEEVSDTVLVDAMQL